MPDHNSAVEWAKEGLPGGLQSKKGQVNVEVKFEGEEEVEVEVKVESEKEAEVQVEVQTEL